MIVSLIYIALALFGLSILIFIHELGHYFMARRVGMRVETFAIGFGKPIFSWIKNGVKWQIGWLPFGGYVKIAGTETDNDQDPYAIHDGFFGKPPIDRIKVAIMGPLVNLLFAFLLFALLWASGGREKNFSEFTPKIGWLDPHSELYAAGIRPGDEITAYDDRPFQGLQSHLYALIRSSSEVDVKGYKVNYATGEKKPFEYRVSLYSNPVSLDKGTKTIGILQPANYLVYDRLPNGKDNSLLEGSPLEGSGIQYGDRIVSVDGEPIFSRMELDAMLNDKRSLLTIERGGKTLLVRVPRVPVKELKLDATFKEELSDWQFEAQLNNVKTANLYVIPYNLTNDCVVENEVKFIDKENQEEIFAQHPFSALEAPLLPDDKILAVDGIAVEHSYQLLSNLQHHQVNVIVERAPNTTGALKGDAEWEFLSPSDSADLATLSQTIGTANHNTSLGNFHLLKPIVPKMRSEYTLSPDKQALLAAEMAEQKKVIEAIEDPEKRTQALHMLEHQEKQLSLGVMVQDRKINYNPSPFTLFRNVSTEIWFTLKGLFSGALSPKGLMGPVGIVQVVYDTWMISVKEALFWLAAISLNLGVINLLPIPVLDGGTIMLSLFEMISGRHIKPKTMERLIVPFAVLLIVFFIFLTYNDLTRIFGGFLH